MPTLEEEEAAAAWRASRTQKSCLHSDKPDDGHKNDKASTSSSWTPFETTWRASTLPFRLAHNSLALTWKPRTRPTWNRQLDQAVVGLKTCYANTPLIMSVIRMFTDRVVPWSAMPEELQHLTQDLGGNLKVSWTFPSSLVHHAEAERFLLYVHSPTCNPGGATMKSLVGRLAIACNAAVLTVDYRMPPEDDRENSVEDLVKAYKWLVTQPGVMPAKLLIMSDGLGAALSLNLMIQIREDDASSGTNNLPAACAFISPWVDLEDDSPSWSKHAEADYANKRVWRFVAEGYCGLLSLSDAQVSPIKADLSGLPPIMISIGTCEVLFDQCLSFAKNLQDARVTVEIDEGEDMIHAFQVFAWCSPACQAGILRLGAFSRKMAPGHQFVNAQVDMPGGLSDMFLPTL